MEKEIKIILGIGTIIGAVVLILWVAGVFKKNTRQTMTEILSMGKPIFNTYILSPNDIWEYWDETGYKTRGTNIQLIVNELFVAQNDKKTAEYGPRRVLIFLLPGVYVNLHIQVGYYTSVAGLGGDRRRYGCPGVDRSAQWRRSLYWGVGEQFPKHFKFNDKIRQNYYAARPAD